jgi:hypothetical protein
MGNLLEDWKMSNQLKFTIKMVKILRTLLHGQNFLCFESFAVQSAKERIHVIAQIHTR